MQMPFSSSDSIMLAASVYIYIYEICVDWWIREMLMSASFITNVILYFQKPQKRKIFYLSKLWSPLHGFGASHQWVILFGIYISPLGFQRGIKGEGIRGISEFQIDVIMKPPIQLFSAYGIRVEAFYRTDKSSVGHVDI